MTRHRLTFAVFGWLVLAVALSAAKDGRKPAEGGVKLGEPLAYGRDCVEVTAAGTLRGRYRFHGDWEKERASYLEDARKTAATRGTPCRKMTMGCIFLKDATITMQDVKGGDGKPMTATYTTPPNFVEAMSGKTIKDYNDYIFTFSGGEVEMDWVVETVEGLRWVQTGKVPGWGCQPKAVGEQITKALEKYKDRGVSMWVFCAGKPNTLNPSDEKGKKGGIGGPPYGISYTAWPLHGGYCLVVCGTDPGLIVHEFNHRYLDNLQQIEGIHLTRFHGLSSLGFSSCGFREPLYQATYRFVYQYIITRDMWRRFTVNATNSAPREAFSGKSYSWDEVKNDCWFKLPELTDSDLAKLTGLTGVKILGDRKSKTDDRRSWIAAESDKSKVKSPYVASIDPAVKDTALNNVLQLDSESCAVLKTDTGQWLMVKKELADLYIDMPKLTGKGASQLPVYGYVNRDILPLIVIKAPADIPVPPSEVGYFRRNQSGVSPGSQSAGN
jgi:hypothetical protein